MSSSNVSEAGQAMQAWAKANAAGRIVPSGIGEMFKDLMKAGEYSKAKVFIENIMSQYPMHPMPPAAPNPLDVRGQARGRRTPTLHERLCMRMGWDNGIAPFHLHLHEDNGVHVLVIKDGEAVLFKDDSSMFPCDETVTKLRMLCS